MRDIDLFGGAYYWDIFWRIEDIYVKPYRYSVCMHFMCKSLIDLMVMGCNVYYTYEVIIVVQFVVIYIYIKVSDFDLGEFHLLYWISIQLGLTKAFSFPAWIIFTTYSLFYLFIGFLMFSSWISTACDIYIKRLFLRLRKQFINLSLCSSFKDMNLTIFLQGNNGRKKVFKENTNQNLY